MFPFSAVVAAPQQAGSIRGVVHDKEFDVPLAAAQVLTVETGQKVTTSDQGAYVFSEVPPGTYTLVFSKEGYVREVKAGVVVTSGRLTDLDVWLAGEFNDMDEFVVQDIVQIGAGSEAALLKLRFESPALMDSIGSDLMSRAGAGDAAAGLRLVAGTSVQDGKYAVVRGLPDRYVSSQMNGVRLPTADENKRAVQLDQFPAPVIESMQVSKTFTPDQQGDASGGAVNVRLKGVPNETLLQFKSQVSYNSQVTGRSDFLTYDGGGVDYWGTDDGSRDIQYENLGSNWTGAAGTTTGDAPIDYKWSTTAGLKHELDDGFKVGGLASLFYERKSSFYDNGKSDSYWVTQPGDPMTPQTYQGTPSQGTFKTGLYDVTRGSQGVQWGGLATLGLESENNAIGLSYLYTRTAEDIATLATDTRGKEYYFPGYDPNDPMAPGNEPGNLGAAPYLRQETLNYRERTTGTLQLTGHHKLPAGDFAIDDSFRFLEPELDWTLARSSAESNEPDKRQFSALWVAASYNPGNPFFPPFTTPPTWSPYKPQENFTIGNFQRIWKDTVEDSDQYFVNLKLPFEQWTETEGYLKFGIFDDQVKRTFDQNTFSNFDDFSTYQGGWNQPWSANFPNENHPITASLQDVDYTGHQDISAFYGMIDLPLSSSVSVVGGARYESTRIGIVNDPESGATWLPPGASAPIALLPGDADVTFEQQDLLPAIGLEYKPIEEVTMRASYSETVARQTFKELTPILQQEYAGGPVFIGNPELQMSALKNYDLRVEYVPYDGALVSGSWFRKDLEDPIEYVQQFVNFTYTTPVNYPKGELDGIELEARQNLSRFWESMEGMAVGLNATFINSDVTLRAAEAAGFSAPGIQAPMSSRDMTGAPAHLYNLFITYDLVETKTQLALFYTVQGDTLVAGATQSSGNFVPNVYATEYDTLNLSMTQKFSEHWGLQLQAKNLTNPEIQEVYRSKYIGDDVTKTSYTKGIEFSLAIGAQFSF